MKNSDLRQASNSELLSRFEERREQSAFAEIVRRHGSMVRQTAWRVTGNVEDSEDAFQATFLALAKSVHRIRDKAALSGWLHRAALSSALQIQRANISWEERSEQMKQRQIPEGRSPVTNVTNDEIRRLIDKEVSALPKPLQAAIVLCELEGLSRSEAAKELGVPRSTVDSHVVKGRQILRQRMTQLGCCLPATGLAAFIALANEGSLAMSDELIETTTSNSSLFAAGKDASEIGIAPRIVSLANGVAAKMTTVFLLPIALAVGLLSVVVASATLLDIDGGTNIASGTVFVDSFENESIKRSAKWTPAPYLNGSFDISSGDLVLSPTDDTDTRFGFGVGLPSVLSRDSSIRTEAKVTANGTVAYAGVRANSTVGPSGYFAAVGYVEEWGGSVFAVGHDVELGMQRLFDSLDGEKFVVLPYDVRRSFTVIQLDVTGKEIRGWAWKSGGAMPSEPQFHTTDETFESGFPTLSIGTNLSRESGNAGKAIFNFVQFATRPIHELGEAKDLVRDVNTPVEK